MWHTCPNYALPYEPHFGLPLVPFVPRVTRVFLPRRISGSELWQSLNFISYFSLRRLARANSLMTEFRQGTMADAFRRLDSDVEFAARQSGLASRIYGILKFTGVLSMIDALPAAVSTPMMVTMQKNQAAS